MSWLRAIAAGVGLCAGVLAWIFGVALLADHVENVTHSTTKGALVMAACFVVTFGVVFAVLLRKT